MYPRNAESPPRIAVGAVVQISDGAVQTSGVSIVVRPEGGSETASGGTVSYGASSGVVYYAPTQGETDYTAFVVTAYKTGCIPASVTVVTSAASVAGQTVPADGAITAAKFASDAITSAKIADGALTAAKFAASSLNGKGDWNTIAPATPTNVTDARDVITALLPAALVGGKIDASVGAVASAAITATGIAAGALNGKGDWNTVAPDNASIAAILQDTGTDIPALLNAIANYIDTEVADIKAKTDNLPADPATETTLAVLDNLLDAVKAVTDQFAFTVPNQVDANALTGGGGDATEAKQDTIIAVIGTPADTDIATDIANVKADTTTLVNRVTATVATLWANLTAMITGTGASAAFTTTAMENVGEVLTGPNAVDITVVDDEDDQPIELANVRLFRTSESGSETTDDDGLAQFSTASATFNVRITAAGYNGLVATLVVGGDVEQEYRLTASSLPAATTPGLCAVSHYVYLNGTPVEGATVTARVKNQNSATATVGLSTKTVSATTDADGLATLQLVQQGQFKRGNGEYVVTSMDGDDEILNKVVRIPNTSSALLRDLL